MREPTQEYILGLWNHLETVWAETHRRWAEVDTYLHGTFKLWPAGVSRPEYHPGTAYALLDHAVNHEMPTKMIVTRFPANQTYRRKRQADTVETFLVSLLAEIARKEAVHTVGQAKRHLLAYGYSILEGPVIDTREYQKMLADGKTGQWNPIRLRAPHPQRILMSPGERAPGEALKSIRRSSEEIKAILERKRTRSEAQVYKDWQPDKEGYQEYSTREYWSEDWHGFLIEDELLYVEPNSWGFLPFIQGFSGWGIEPTDWKEINPKYLAVSLLEHVLEGLKLEAQRKTAQHNAVIEAGFQRQGYDPSVGGGLDPAQAAETIARDGLLPGRKEAWWWRDTPRLPDWLFQVGQEIDQDIENATFSKTIAGQRLPGVNTVGQQAILSTTAARKFDAPSLQIDEMFSVACGNVLRLIDVLGVPLTVRGVTVGPADIRGDYAVDVTFQKEDPVMMAQERSIGLKELEAGVLDPETYLEDTGRPNAQEIIRKALANKILNTEQIIAAIVEAAAPEFRERHRPKGSGLLGPDGQPAQNQPTAPVVPAGPALEAMQNMPGGTGEAQVLDGQIAGLTNGAGPTGV